jgi:multidrug efflux pump
MVDAVKALLPKLEQTMPAGIDVAVLSDQTGTIGASITDIEFELGLAVALVVMVIFIFLRNLPATLIPSLSVPLSLVGTLAGMYCSASRSTIYRSCRSRSRADLSSTTRL